MQKLFTILFFINSIAFSDLLIHPLDFKGTDKEKQLVIKYIEENVRETYCAIGMCEASVLRMMEEEELRSFKILIEAKNRYVLDSVIETYCSIGMCNYSTISMMYNEELNASEKTLKW